MLTLHQVEEVLRDLQKLRPMDGPPIRSMIFPVLITERVRKSMFYFIDGEGSAHLSYRHQLARGQVAVSKAL